MTKHLFRLNLVNPRTKFQAAVCDKTESFEVSDIALKKFFPVHVFDVDCEHVFEDPLWFGRDSLFEWYSNLVVKDELYTSPGFLHMMKEIGYDKNIAHSKILAEGGRFVLGENFIFISDVFPKESFERILKYEEKDVEIYTMPSLTDTINRHIDCDYSIVDLARTIYCSDLAFNVQDEDCVKAKKSLESIAKKQNYDLRPYPITKEIVVVEKKDLDKSPIQSTTTYIPDINDYSALEFFQKFHGINSIIDGNRFFTGYTTDKEKAYLASKRIEAISIPLGKISPGSGLRCCYGEFNID